MPHDRAADPAGIDPSDAGGPTDTPVVFVVDDQYFARSCARQILEEAGWLVEDFASCEAFLAAYTPDRQACLVLDVHFPGMGGIEMLGILYDTVALPTVIISGSSSIPEAVTTMKAGAIDFIQKPIDPARLIDAVGHALDLSRMAHVGAERRHRAADRLAGLTARQRQIMALILAGKANKNIAHALGISQRTVENHRAAIMHKTRAASLPALASLAIAATR
jgi:two-component system CheB/CheR fusion protein